MKSGIELMGRLQLFAGEEDVTIDSLLDLLGDHTDMTANMSDEAVALLVIASRIENIGRILKDINSTLTDMSADISTLGNYYVGYEPPRQGHVQGEGHNLFRIGGSEGAEG